MRIHSIASTPSFGYNKELNDKVNDRLSKSGSKRPFDKTLLDLNRFCLSLEDDLRAAEKNRSRNLVERYSDMLVFLKAWVSSLIEDRFPDMNYWDVEYTTYLSEIKHRKLENKPEHWLNSLMKSAYMHSSLILYAMTGLGQVQAPQDSPTNDNAHEQVEQKEPPKDMPSKSNLEIFIPNKNSPKSLSDLGGMEELKKALYDEIIVPVLDPELARQDELEYGKTTSGGVLLYGPPGCGKTAIIEAISMEARLPLYKVKVANTGSIYINESAQKVQTAYNFVRKKAMDTGKPVMLFIDEAESLAPKRKDSGNSSEDNKVVSTLLQIMDNAKNDNVVVIYATNKFDMLDEAIKSRLENKTYVGLPDEDTRVKVLEVLLNRISKGRELADNPDELRKVAKMTDGFSNRDLVMLTNKAANIARLDNRRAIMAKDYEKPVEQNQSSKVDARAYMPKNMNRRPIGYGH